MDWVLLIPALPALAFLVFMPLSRAMRNRLVLVPVIAMATSCLLSIAAFVQVWPGGQEEPVWSATWTFGRIGVHTFDATFALDPLAAATLMTVTIVATCVQVYSLGYMHRDERVGWYFAVMSLFTTAMLVLVLSENLLFTFSMWEMMGPCPTCSSASGTSLRPPARPSQKAF
jgi:NADH-quinone oxidoreductase subunit L